MKFVSLLLALVDNVTLISRDHTYTLMVVHSNAYTTMEYQLCTFSAVQNSVLMFSRNL
jgi:hypothetical protein